MGDQLRNDSKGIFQVQIPISAVVLNPHLNSQQNCEMDETK